MESDVTLQQATGIGDYIGSLFTVLLSLAFIIVLIVLFIKLLSRKNRLWQANQSIRLLGGTGLGQHKSLQVVEVGNVVYVLGIGEDITVVDKVSDPEQVAILLQTFKQAEPVFSASSLPQSVSQWIRQRRSKRSNLNETNIEPYTYDNDEVSFHEMFQSKLDEKSDRQSRVDRLWNDNTKEDR